MVAPGSSKPTAAVCSLPLSNDSIAERLDEAAELLEGREANPFRVRAYRRAAETILGSSRPVADILAIEGVAGLTEFPGIGDSIAHVVERLCHTGEWPLLDQLRGKSRHDAVLATVPGVGAKTAALIRERLGIETLEELEAAAYDGRLELLPGIGRKRLRAVRESLAGRFARRTPFGTLRSAGVLPQPAVATLLSIDDEYRRRIEHGRLVRVAPLRFNPDGRLWLPVMRTTRDGRRYTAMYSNTPRAHELVKTHDWVIILRQGAPSRGPWTVVTAGRGPLEGRRVVRGREAECEAHYARVRELDFE